MKLYNYIPSRHDIFLYDGENDPEIPLSFNPGFYLSSYSLYLSCLDVRPRWLGVPHADGVARATLVSPLHVLGHKDNPFNVGDSFIFYNHTFTLSFMRTISSKVIIGENLILGELDEAINEDEVIPSRFILSNDGDIDNNLVGETVLVVDQDDRIGIREISSVDSDNLYHIEGPSNLPDGYLVDDKIEEFFPGDDSCPVFYPDDHGRIILLGFLNETGTYFELLSRSGAQINDIIDSYGYSLNYVNPFESDTEFTSDTPTIRIEKRVYWHIATSSNSSGAEPVFYDPGNDPENEPGVSTLVTYNGGSVSDNYLSGSVYAIDRLCLFPQNVSIPVHTGNYDFSPGYFIFQPTHEGLKKIFPYPDGGGTPVDIDVPEKVSDLTSYCVLNYMLFGAYNEAAESCLNAGSPDSFFDSSDTDAISDIARSSDDANKMTDRIKPHQDVFSDGNNAGFYFKMQEVEEIDKVGCCDVIIGGEDCEYHPYPGPPEKWTRIWMVRQWVNTWFDTRKNDENYPPLAAELVYADLDENLGSPNWVHSGFITFEDQSPYIYDGMTLPTSFNGNLKDYRSGFNIDIQDISWDNKGRLWALCSGGFDDDGTTDDNSYVTSSGITTVEGIYQLLPGGKSKRTRRDDVEIDIFFPARLLRRERIKHTYASPIDVPYVWLIKPINDVYFDGAEYANSINSPGVSYSFSDISSIISHESGPISGYDSGKMPLYVRYEDDLNDATIRVMEWHWRPYKDREPKYNVNKYSNAGFGDYDAQTLLDENPESFNCFSTGTMQGARPRRFRNFLDSSGVLTAGGGIQTDEIYNQQPAETSDDLSYMAYFSDPGLRGVYTYEAPFVSEYIKYSNETDGGELKWDKYLNDNFMQFNFIDSHPESKKYRLRTSWESKIWRKRETLPRETIFDSDDQSTVYNPGDWVSSVGIGDGSAPVSDHIVSWGHQLGYSVAIAGDLVAIGEPYGSMSEADYEVYGPDGSDPQPDMVYRSRANGCVMTWDLNQVDGSLSWDHAGGMNRVYSKNASGQEYGSAGDKDRFGTTVAVTQTAYEGDTLMVGSPMWHGTYDGSQWNHVESDSGIGQIHFYRRHSSGGIWEQPETGYTFTNDLEAQGNGSNTPTADGTYQTFGQAIDIDGNTAVVGHATHMVGGNANHGCIFILEYDTAEYKWVNDAKSNITVLFPPDGNPSLFGKRVAISGNTIVVANGFGGVFIYERADNQSEFLHIQTLPDVINLLDYNDPSTGFEQMGQRLGTIAIDGDIIMFSSKITIQTKIYNSVKVYEKNTDSGSENFGQFEKTDEIHRFDVDDVNTGALFGLGGNNCISISEKDGEKIAVIGAPEATGYAGAESFQYKYPLGKTYVYKRGLSKTWSCIGQLYDSDRDGGWSEVQKFGHASVISGDQVVVGAPRDYGPAAGDGQAFTFNPIDSSNSYSSYTHDFAGKLSRGKSLYRYSGLHGLADPFDNYFVDTDAYVHLWIDDMGEIQPDNLNNFAVDGEAAHFKLRVREYWSHVDEIVNIKQWYDSGTGSEDAPENGIPNAGVHKISDFNVIPFTNTQENNGEIEYVDRGFFVVMVFYDAEPPIDSSIFHTAVGRYVTTISRIFHYPNVDSLETTAGWSSPDMISNENPDDIRSFAMTRPVYQRNFNSKHSPYRKIGAASGGVFISSEKTQWILGGQDEGIYLHAEYSDPDNLDKFDGQPIVDQLQEKGNRLILYPKIGSYYPVDSINDEYSPYNPQHYSARGLDFFESEWLDIVRHVNMPIFIGPELGANSGGQTNSKYIKNEYRNWEIEQGTLDLLHLNWCSNDESGGSNVLSDIECLPFTTYPYNNAGYMNQTTGQLVPVTPTDYGPLALCTRSLQLSIICTDNIGDMGRCRFRLEWSSTGVDDQGPDHPEYPSAIFQITNNGSYRMDDDDPSAGNDVPVSNEKLFNQTLGHYHFIGNSTDYGEHQAFGHSFIDYCDNGTAVTSGIIFQCHFQPAKEKVFVDARTNNSPWIMTSGTHTDRAFLPKFQYNIPGAQDLPNSCLNYVANRTLSWGFGAGWYSYPIKGEGQTAGYASPYLFYRDQGQDAAVLQESSLGIMFSIYAVHTNETLAFVFSFLRGLLGTTTAHFVDAPDEDNHNQLAYSTVQALTTDYYVVNDITYYESGKANLIFNLTPGGQFMDENDYFDANWNEDNDWANARNSLIGQNVVATNDLSQILLSFTRSSKVNTSTYPDLWTEFPPFVSVYSLTEYNYSSTVHMSRSNMGNEETDIGLAGLRIYPSSGSGHYIIADIDESIGDIYNDSEVLFTLFGQDPDAADEFTECNTFYNADTEGYDNAFANANSWVPTPMTARNGSQSMVFDPVDNVMYVRSGNSFYTLRSIPEVVDGAPLTSTTNMWEIQNIQKMFDQGHPSYPSYLSNHNIIVHRNPYETELPDEFACNAADKPCDIWQNINSYAPPSTYSGNNYNICRLMVYKYAGNSADGLYQFDGVNSKETDGSGVEFGFPTLEHDVSIGDGSPTHTLNTPYSYLATAQTQYNVLNDYAAVRRLHATSEPDTRYDPPTVISLKTVDKTTGESLYLSDILSSQNGFDGASTATYTPYLLIRYPVYQNEYFTQGLDSEELNRSFTFCSSKYQMQLAFDRTSKASSSYGGMGSFPIVENLIISGIPGSQAGQSVSIFDSIAAFDSRANDTNTVIIYYYDLISESWMQDTSIERQGSGNEDINFGSSIHVSRKSNGDYIMLVGADKFSNTVGGSSVYSYTKDTVGDDLWIESETIIGTNDFIESDSFGFSCSYSLMPGSQDEVIVIGAPNYDHTDSVQTDMGAVYVRDKIGGSVTETFIQGTNGIDGAFGYSVSSDGNRFVVGIPRYDTSPGKIAIYEYVGASWAQDGSNILPTDSEIEDQFGFSVAMDGDWIAVGAPGANIQHDDQIVLNAGAVYVFWYNSSTGGWDEAQKIQLPFPNQDDNFGCSVDISANKLIVGAKGVNASWENYDHGRAYIYEMTFGDPSDVDQVEFTFDTGVYGDSPDNRISISNPFGLNWHDGGTPPNGFGTEGVFYVDVNESFPQYGYFIFSSTEGWDIRLTSLDVTGYYSMSPYDCEVKVYVDGNLVFTETVAMDGDAVTNLTMSGVHLRYGSEIKVQLYDGGMIQRHSAMDNINFDIASNDMWSLVYTASASDAQDNDQFGTEVSVSSLGGHFLIGAPQADNASGKVYIFGPSGGDDADWNYIYGYGLDNNQNAYHGTFMQVDWHDTSGGGFLEDAPGDYVDKLYVVQDVVREHGNLSNKETTDFGGQICSIDLSGQAGSSPYAPVIEHQYIFVQGVGTFTGDYPELDNNAITVGCHTPGAFTPDITFPYRSPFFLMDYYKEDNSHYQPMGFFVDNMSDSNVFYRYNDYGEVIFSPEDEDPYLPASGQWSLSGRACVSIDTDADFHNFAKHVLVKDDLLFVHNYKKIDQDPPGPGNEEIDDNSILVYRKNSQTGDWDFEQELTNPDNSSPHTSLSSTDFGFGMAYEPDKSLLIVGAPAQATANGKVFVFEYSYGSQTWSHNQSLDSPDSGLCMFGNSIGVKGDVLVIGSPLAGGAIAEGRAYVYKHDGTEFILEHTLSATEEDQIDPGEFGWSVAINDNLQIAVGYPFYKGDFGYKVGCVYVYTYNSSDMSTADEVVLPVGVDGGDPDENVGFGWLVAINNDHLIVPIQHYSSSGAVHFYKLIDGYFNTPTNTIVSTYGSSTDIRMGSSISLSENYLLVSMGQDSSDNEGDEPFFSKAFAELYYYDGSQWSFNVNIETPTYQVNEYDYEGAEWTLNYPVGISNIAGEFEMVIGIHHHITVDALTTAGCVFRFAYGGATTYDDFFGDITRLERCREILTDLFDMNYGQVYCDDRISIAALDFINGAVPTSYPSVIDTAGKISNKKIESREDLKSAIEFTDILTTSNVSIGGLFYHLNCLNIDSRFKENVSPYRAYKSMVFMITSNDDHFEIDNSDITNDNINNIISNLRSQAILHPNGSIHVADFVPRDPTSLVRIGLTKLAEMSGGYYTSLRGGQV